MAGRGVRSEWKSKDGEGALLAGGRRQNKGQNEVALPGEVSALLIIPPGDPHPLSSSKIPVPLTGTTEQAQSCIHACGTRTHTGTGAPNPRGPPLATCPLTTEARPPWPRGPLLLAPALVPKADWGPQQRNPKGRGKRRPHPNTGGEQRGRLGLGGLWLSLALP